MPSYEDIRNNLLDKLNDSDTGSTEFSDAVKSLKVLEEANKIHHDTEVEEDYDWKRFLKDHAGDFIRVGGTLVTVVAIGIVENKFDVIFRSKASKYL